MDQETPEQEEMEVGSLECPGQEIVFATDSTGLLGPMWKTYWSIANFSKIRALSYQTA